MNGADVRRVQAELKLSNLTLCRSLGITEATLCNWKSGRVRVPNPASLALMLLDHYRGDLKLWVK